MRVGRYQVVGRLATGGMAEVLLGKILGPAGFEQPVVLKRILPHLAAEPAFKSMFVQEAQMISHVRHPNVVRVFELVDVESEDHDVHLMFRVSDGPHDRRLAVLWLHDQFHSSSSLLDFFLCSSQETFRFVPASRPAMALEIESVFTFSGARTSYVS